MMGMRMYVVMTGSGGDETASGLREEEDLECVPVHMCVCLVVCVT